MGNPLSIASSQGDLETVKMLIENGADPIEKNMKGSTALMYAAQYGHLQICKLLIEHGADPNEKNEHAETALLFASRNGDLETIKLLMENGVDPNEKNNNGFTAFMLASMYGYSEIKLFLLEYGAETDEPMERRMVKLIQNRIDELSLIRNAICATIFPDDTPVIANIISQYTNGLENLINYRDRR